MSKESPSFNFNTSGSIWQHLLNTPRFRPWQGNLDGLNQEYKKLCAEYSPAYLAGSSWYVGPCLKTYLLCSPWDEGSLEFLFLLNSLKNNIH